MASCRYCGSEYHTAFLCQRKPKKPLRISRRLNRIGKVTQKWIETRAEWVALNPPDRNSNYICHICGQLVPATEMELDHVKSRSRYPELRFDLSNLKPSHHNCNFIKGSRDIL